MTLKKIHITSITDDINETLNANFACAFTLCSKYMNVKKNIWKSTLVWEQICNHMTNSMYKYIYVSFLKIIFLIKDCHNWFTLLRPLFCSYFCVCHQYFLFTWSCIILSIKIFCRNTIIINLKNICWEGAYQKKVDPWWR